MALVGGMLIGLLILMIGLVFGMVVGHAVGERAAYEKFSALVDEFKAGLESDAKKRELATLTLEALRRLHQESPLSAKKDCPTGQCGQG